MGRRRSDDAAQAAEAEVKSERISPTRMANSFAVNNTCPALWAAARGQLVLSRGSGSRLTVGRGQTAAHRASLLSRLKAFK